MKQFRNFGWLAVALGCAVVPCAALGLESPLDLVRSLSHSFLLHSSQGYLGVDVKDIGPDRANALHLKSSHGAEVITVDHDAPAAKAGLRVHDVILEMDGHEITGCDQLRRMLRKEAPGRTVNFVVSRDGNPLTLNVELADRAALEHQAWSQHFSVPAPAESEPTSGGESFVSSGSPGGSHFLGALLPNSLYVGADVSPVHAQLAEYFGVTDGMGLLVESVDSQSPAAQAGLQAGDVILKVNARPIFSRSDWVKAIRNNRGKPVDIVIMRNKQQQTLTMLAGRSKKHG